MAKSAIGMATQSNTENASTASVETYTITPLSYFTNGAVSMLLSRMDGAESRTVHGETVVVFPNELLNATSEELEASVQSQALAILHGTITLPDGEVKSVVDAARWYCEAIKRGNNTGQKYSTELWTAQKRGPQAVVEVMSMYTNKYANFNDLTAKPEDNKVCLVEKDDYAKAEVIQSFFADNMLNLARGDYRSLKGQGTIWTLGKIGVFLGDVA